MRVDPFDAALIARDAFVRAEDAFVRAEVERKGRSKSDFELVIALTAIEQGATLITNDAARKDGAIEGMVVEDWLTEIRRELRSRSRPLAGVVSWGSP
ncbi:MAG TPA: hypothetical protein VJV79_01280 [Polyangiaceae bacterium]|nr:hypothetical protein [Polyangiaceae bacterium]